MPVPVISSALFVPSREDATTDGPPDPSTGLELGAPGEPAHR